ncbi:globin-coupled sensor protein [Blastomonas sp. UPD001]|jgi:methyl-accepting chemotaxis protein|uniref:globin-coupled sensor protein n=1 Tax=Blastomonas sp. UPD001 TaxID=2217673 RepID=UPI000E344D12|nr:globin-coupled sensor protein [Blastomonas sp. UPD001]
MDTASANQDRLSFFGIDGKDYKSFPRILKLLQKHAPGALADFYEKIAATPDVAKFFKSKQNMDHARDKQLNHWVQLFSNQIGESYFGKAEQIGSVHARIGLAPTWYIGGYAMVLEQLIHEAVAGSPLARLAGNNLGKIIGTLVKCALLDMDIALSSYFRAEEAQRLAVISQVGQALESLAKGDFTVRLQGLPPAFSKVEQDFEFMRSRINEALAQVAETAESINTGSIEISQASDDLSSRTEQQAASLEQTAAAMDQLTGGVRETADGAAHVNRSVAEAHSDATRGGAVVKEAVAAMDDIERSAQEIAKIINVIDGIAFQTNLLALNAGVEAARAGDAGKGFAVVANEVRALAQRSADAAKHIKELISESSRQVNRGVELVGQSGEALDSIVGKVAEIAGLAANISELAAAQSNSLQQVNTAVSEMDKMTQQNAAMVEESTAAARSLATEADQLSGLVSHFSLEGGAPGRGSTVREMPRVAAARRPARASARTMTQGNLAVAINTDPSEDWSEF